jgi:hypothetical protein
MSTPKRPVPEDFVSVAADLTDTALCARYRAHLVTIRRFRQETGITFTGQIASGPTSILAPVPADFAEQAAKMNQLQLKQHYERHADTIRRWCKETGITPFTHSRVKPERPIPADFATLYPTMSIKKLGALYKTAPAKVLIWADALGIRRAKGCGHIGVVTKPAPVKPASARSAPKLVAHHPLAMLSRHRDMSAAGQAADYLRQFGAVWRCTETGRPDPAGKCWRRGSAVLSAAEIVERADWMRNRRMAA